MPGGRAIVVIVGLAGCGATGPSRTAGPVPVSAARPEEVPARDEDAALAIESADRCPEAKENFNGIADEDGCPESLPAELAAITGTIAGLKFRFERDIIEAGQEELRAIAEVLRAYPEVVIEIRGHTPVSPVDSYGINLSQRRAAAVRNFLIAHGVEASRLYARGYGATQPLDLGRTVDGRARNARVELVIVER